MPDSAKSIADLLSSLLEDWGKFCRFILLLFVACLLTLAVAYGVLKMLPSNTGQVKLGSGSIIFSQPTEGGGNAYFVVISPQGWQETGIPVHQGEHLSIQAYGKVHIDLSGLNATLTARRTAEERVINDEKNAKRWEAEKDNFAPEDHYTAKEKGDMRPTWHWTGPDGISDTPLYALKARMDRCVMPGQKYGSLLGAIREAGVKPAGSDVFLVGSGTDKSGVLIPAHRSGILYFTVNDVLSDDKDYPDMFFEDNIGFFYAKVTISK